MQGIAEKDLDHYDDDVFESDLSDLNMDALLSPRSKQSSLSDVQKQADDVYEDLPSVAAQVWYGMVWYGMVWYKHSVN